MYNNIKQLNNQPMNEKEQHQAIKDFAKVLSLLDTEYTHANPLEQNCYISSSGQVAGIYFPNTQFKNQLHTYFYNVECLAKCGEKLGIIYSLKDDAEEKDKYKSLELSFYKFESFENILFDKEELKIKARLEDSLKHCVKQLNTLNRIKRQRTKKGEDFAVFSKNFSGCYIRIDYSIFGGSISHIEFASDVYNSNEFEETTIYFQENNTKERTGIIDLVFEKIEKQKEQTKKTIEKYKQQLKDLHSEFLKYKKLKIELLNKLRKDEKIQDGKYRNSLGFALIDYLKDIGY